uniref:Uncharacterized protein n=1 Tax=Avena sativa TaxID=4498 RepID=A0ACD6A093_AVESA
MARKKVPLVYIQNKYSRRDTFKTRSQGLMKKAGEIATMCGTKACVIIFPEGERVPQAPTPHFTGSMDAAGSQVINGGMHTIRARAPTPHFTGGMDTAGSHMPIPQFTGGMHTIGVQAPTPHFTGGIGVHTVGSQAPIPHFTGGMHTIGAQAPTPHFTGGMHTFGAQAPTPHIIGSMDTAGTQAPIPHFTSGMHTTGAPASPQQHETWLELMRSGGGDLDALVYSGFNTGASTSASAAAGLNNDGMMQTFDAGFGYPWGGAHPGPSSSSFPPM